MNVFEDIVLGLVQSITEFFPISSSAHLIILPNILGWGDHPLVFDLVVHLGTALSLVVFFRKDLWQFLISLHEDTFCSRFKKKFSKFNPDSKLALYLIVGTIPAVFLGLFLGDWIEANTRELYFIIVFLILGTLLMIGAELKARKKTIFKEIGFSRAFTIGFFQALALFPGFSRSGSTIAGGMLTGMSRTDSVRFAFLLAIPIILGAGITKVSLDLSVIYAQPLEIFSAFISSFVFGLFALNLLTLFLKKGTLVPFIVYRIILVIFLLVYISNR